MKIYQFLLSLGIILFGLSACQPDQPQMPDYNFVTFEVKAPLGSTGELSNLKGTLTHKKTGEQRVLTFDQLKASLKLIQGDAYSLKLTATYTLKEAMAEIEYADDFTAENKSTSTKVCQLIFEMPKESFVISEIFFAGTRDRKGEQYDEDKYIKITNNSPITRYADGLALVQSLWQSDEKKEKINPMVIDTHLVAGVVMQIPGSGKDYPVKPYESIILCNSAINHSKENPNSIDLSGATFEWMSDKGYTDSGTPDNPDVPNMKMVFLSDPFGEGLHNWVMNNNGQHSYALVNLQGKTPEQLAVECKYEYTEVMMFEGVELGEVPGQPALKLPIEWVVDAVNLSMKDGFEWLPISSKLDAGYASVVDKFGDDARYGKKVVRKLLHEGAKPLKDSNNSSDDFKAAELK